MENCQRCGASLKDDKALCEDCRRSIGIGNWGK